MKKDIPLIMERTVKTYCLLLFVSFILKLLGLDIVGIDASSPIILYLDKLFNNYIIYNFVCFLFIMFYQHVMTSLILNKNVKKLTLYSIISTFIFQYYIKSILITYHLNLIGEILYLFILCLIYNKINKTTDRFSKRFIIVILLNILFEAISAITRYRYASKYILSPTINIILTIDYSLAMLLTYKIYFMKGDVNLCVVFREVAGLFLQKLTSSVNSLKNYLQKFLTKNKQIQFEITLFTILCLFWNIFTVLCVLFVAFLNNTFVECIFILSSFWLNKKVFGEEFHLKNAAHCFIVSNLTYYCLNRITTNLNISMIIPICLGILLAYFTSKLVKKNKKKLYRGMTEDELKYWLDKVTNNKLDYKICKLYYVDRYSEIKVASMTCYSVENIKKRKRVINDLLKELII